MENLKKYKNFLYFELLDFFLLIKKSDRFHLILHQNGKLFSIFRNDAFTNSKCKEAEFILQPQFMLFESFYLLIDDKFHKVTQIANEQNQFYECPEYWHESKNEKRLKSSIRNITECLFIFFYKRNEN